MIGGKARTVREFVVACIQGLSGKFYSLLGQDWAKQ
jgi:hypothetical protein